VVEQIRCPVAFDADRLGLRQGALQPRQRPVLLDGGAPEIVLAEEMLGAVDRGDVALGQALAVLPDAPVGRCPAQPGRRDAVADQVAPLDSSRKPVRHIPAGAFHRGCAGGTGFSIASAVTVRVFPS